MTMSAIIMGITGVVLSFLPHELLSYLNATTGTIIDALLLQILGALYFAFAMMNWTAKANLIGGIYARPLAIGNLTHFVIGALALSKGYSLSQPIIFQAITLIYIVFAISFVIVFFRHPVTNK
jgi:hypothetical protein